MAVPTQRTRRPHLDGTSRLRLHRRRARFDCSAFQRSATEPACRARPSGVLNVAGHFRRIAGSPPTRLAGSRPTSTPGSTPGLSPISQEVSATDAEGVGSPAHDAHHRPGRRAESCPTSHLEPGHRPRAALQNRVQASIPIFHRSLLLSVIAIPVVDAGDV